VRGARADNTRAIPDSVKNIVGRALRLPSRAVSNSHQTWQAMRLPSTALLLRRTLDAEWKRVVGINNERAPDFTAKTGLIFPRSKENLVP